MMQNPSTRLFARVAKLADAIAAALLQVLYSSQYHGKMSYSNAVIYIISRPIDWQLAMPRRCAASASGIARFREP